MEHILDIFEDDAFSLVTLTTEINKMPYVPGRIGRMGLFSEDGIDTTDLALSEVSGTIALVPNQQRGAPPVQNKPDKRTVRKLSAFHLPVSDTIMADEVQNIRAFGTENKLEAVQSVVNRRMQRMTKSLDATLEYGRIGALKGVILDSDGSTTLYNLFTEFGVSQQTHDFEFSDPALEVINEITDMAGLIEDELGGDDYDHIHVLCGKTYWKDFIAHPAVKDAYRYYQVTGLNQGQPLRDDLRYKGFRFGDVIWEQYRGSVGGVTFQADAEAQAFPVGVQDLFQTKFAPADYWDTVNTMGLPRYAKQYVADNRGSGVVVEVQTNPISICTRPRVLIKLTKS